MLSKLREVKQFLVRLYEFIPIIWKHRDWDYSYILDFNAYLHQRLYKGLYVNGHHEFTKYDTRKLKTVIELYKRLGDEENYDLFATDTIDRIYGPPEYGRTEFDLKHFLTVHNVRYERLTPEQKVIYNRLNKHFYKQAEKKMQDDMKLLHKLIQKKHRKWWD